MSMNAARPDFRDEELLAAVVADLISDVRRGADGVVTIYVKEIINQ